MPSSTPSQAAACVQQQQHQQQPPQPSELTIHRQSMAATSASSDAAPALALAHLRAVVEAKARQQPAGQATSSTDNSPNTVDTTTTSSTTSGCPWLAARMNSDNVKFTRRHLRKLGKCWTMEEVKQHKFVDDAWIAVDGKVYDITEHILTHPGWHTAGITTVLSIISHIGSECTEEFTEIHRPYPVAWRQLQAYYIGDLAEE